MSTTTPELKRYSDEELEKLFTQLDGNYADYYHPLSDEVIAQFESATYPLPTEIDVRTGWLLVSGKGIQAMLAELWERHTVVPEYLCFHSEDLRARIFATSCNTTCWGCHAPGEFAGMILVRTYTHRYWVETHMEPTRYVRDDRLPQGTMMFLYRKEQGHAS